MAISEKARKILWGRSGNRCALCRHVLVIDANGVDDESVVGDECHLVSGKAKGPRHDPALPPERLDEPENLILLCRVHHKMVDDQCETYTVEVLQRLKANHERWVSSSLADVKQVPLRIRRIKADIPSHLMRLTTGRDVMKIVGDASAFSFDHAEPESDGEVALLGGFLQEAQDWGELWSGLEASERVNAAYRMSTLMRELDEAGFWVFGGHEVQRVEGGVGAPISFTVAIMRVVRAANADVIQVNPQRTAAETDHQMVPNNAPPESAGGDV